MNSLAGYAYIHSLSGSGGYTVIRTLIERVWWPCTLPVRSPAGPAPQQGRVSLAEGLAHALSFFHQVLHKVWVFWQFLDGGSLVAVQHIRIQTGPQDVGFTYKNRR